MALYRIHFKLCRFPLEFIFKLTTCLNCISLRSKLTLYIFFYSFCSGVSSIGEIEPHAGHVPEFCFSVPMLLVVGVSVDTVSITLLSVVITTKFGNF